MHPLARIPFAQVELSWDRAVPGGGERRARQLRGALAHAFRADDLFHQHDPVTGKPLYRYPRVQYRWHRGRGLVIGWDEAAERLLGLPWLDLTLQLGNDPVIVSDAALTLQHAQFGVGRELLHYRLRSPVLLFNQDNYHRYQALSETEQGMERDRLLVASLLIALRGLDIAFPERLLAAFTNIRSHPCGYKGEKLIGIMGELVTNAVLPNGFAFGHAVSHGFGWIETRI